MPEIVCYLPTYSPETEADTAFPRPITRATDQEIASRIDSDKGRKKPWMYLDSIDSILNHRPDIKLVVGDGRSSESIREVMKKHHRESRLEHLEMQWTGGDVPGSYDLELYPEKMSQWIIFNDIFKKYCDEGTKYFIYSSSDVIWQNDWVSEAIKEFEKNPRLQILFPCVKNGDPNLPCQIADGPRDIDSFKAPYQEAAKAPVLNAYVMMFRMDFLRAYAGYPTVFRNCFTESFLSFMCDAVGGEMRIAPRCWAFHYGEGDMWTTPGSAYFYTEEKMIFQDIMNRVQMHRAMNIANVDFYKKILYKKE